MKQKQVALSWRQKRLLSGYLYVLPLIFGVTCVFVPSLITTIRFSLSDIIIGGTGYTLDYKGIKYYVDALTDDPYFVPNLIASFKTLLINMVVILIFSLFIASLLNQKFHGRTLARIIFFIPVILSTGIIVSQDSNTMGFLSNSLAQFGGEGETADFTQFTALLTSLNFNKTLSGIVVSAVSGIYDIVNSSGMQIFILLVGFQAISPSLYEAASVEGCSKWELFWKITFPMISPQIAVSTIYTIVDICSVDKALFPYIREIAFNRNQYGLATAMSILYLLCLTVIVLIVFYILKKFMEHQS